MFHLYDGHTDKAAASRRNLLLKTVIGDVARLAPDSPHFVLGDFNADLEDLEAVWSLVTRGVFTDLGGTRVAERFGLAASLPTCHARNAVRSARRDSVLANGLALSLIDDFAIIYEHTLRTRTHAVLQVRLKPPDAGTTVHALRLPRPLRTLLPQ